MLTQVWILVSITTGRVSVALLGPRFLYRLRDVSIRRLLVDLLVLLGLLMTVEVILPAFRSSVPAALGWRVLGAAASGLGIGLVASLLGVAGGELIAPTLVVLFGLDMETAGTASPSISVPTGLVGLWAYLRLGAFRDREGCESLSC